MSRAEKIKQFGDVTIEEFETIYKMGRDDGTVDTFLKSRESLIKATSRGYRNGREDMFKLIFESYHSLSDENFEAMLLSMRDSFDKRGKALAKSNARRMAESRRKQKEEKKE